jgi:hypothetical protein
MRKKVMEKFACFKNNAYTCSGLTKNIMRVREYDEVKLKVTMPNGQIIIDSGPLDIVCDNFCAGCPVNWDTDDARLEILDSLNEGTPGCEAEFITDNSVWESLVKRADVPGTNVFRR